MPHVLLVEDNESTNQHLAKLLAGIEGVVVTQAYNQAQAEEAIRVRQPDLAVLDIDLGPGVREKFGGWTLFHALSAMGCTTIIVSGMPDPDHIAKELAISQHAFDFLSKPVTPLDFVHKVQQALEWKRPGASNIERSSSIWPDGLTEDPDAKPCVRWQGKPVNLSLTELQVVYCLIDPPGTPVKSERLARIMKSGANAHTVSSHITNIRKKFMDGDQFFDRITTVPAKGYVWKTNQ